MVAGFRGSNFPGCSSTKPKIGNALGIGRIRRENAEEWLDMLRNPDNRAGYRKVSTTL
jgi:hypothetical protein